MCMPYAFLHVTANHFTNDWNDSLAIPILFYDRSIECQLSVATDHDALSDVE